MVTDLSRLALNTASLGHNLDGHGQGWPVERVIDGCAARGYGGIVFWRRELGDRPDVIGDRVRAAGLQVVGLCRTPFLVGPDAPASMDETRAAIDTAAALGAPVLTIVVGGVEPGLKGIGTSLDRLADRVARAAEIAAATDVRLALEPLHPVYAGNRSCLVSLGDALEVCDRVGADNVGVAVDVYHTWWDRSLPEMMARAGPDRLLGVHLCDWLADTQDVLLDRGMMGDGVADIAGLCRDADAAGYTGAHEVEIFSARTWWRKDPGEVLDTIAARYSDICQPS